MFKLIRHAKVYAPADCGICDVLVCAESIVAVGECGTFDITGIPVDIFEAEGRILIPGLIDGHAHITGGGGEAGPETAVPALLSGAITRAGITTVIGLLGTDDIVRTTRSLVHRIHALRREGLGAFGYTGGYHLPPMTLTGSVRGDIVDIDCLIGFGELAISDHRSSQPRFDEICRIASEVHVAGLMTGKAGVLHLHVGDGNRGLEMVRKAVRETELPARIFQPTHVNRTRSLFEEACMLSREGCHIDVTAFPFDPENKTEWTAFDAWSLFTDAGMPANRITISSDGGGCLPTFDETGTMTKMGVAVPGSLSDCLRDLLNSGRPPEQVLPAFTSNVAEYLRLQRIGEIRTGFIADLVVLDDRNDVSDVMARGEWFVRNGAVVRPGTFEVTART